MLELFKYFEALKLFEGVNYYPLTLGFTLTTKRYMAIYQVTRVNDSRSIMLDSTDSTLKDILKIEVEK